MKHEKCMRNLIQKLKKRVQLGDLRTDDKTIIERLFQEIKYENANWIFLFGLRIGYSVGNL